MAGDTARILLYSTRNLNRHVSTCQRYEFEDVIAEADGVSLVAPAHPQKRRDKWSVRVARKVLRLSQPLLDTDITLDTEYDLFVAMCRRPRDLRYLRHINGLRKRCHSLVCLFDEAWPDDIEKSSASDLELLAMFDFVFVNVEAGVEPIGRSTEGRVQYMPYGVDAISFCPYPDNPTRCVDVLSMGRRPEGLHRTLLARAQRLGEFYIYDTVSNFTVTDPWEHRRLLSNLIKRSRYFIAYPGRFDQQVPQFLLGNRYFEGAAGGAILLGLGPADTDFERYFDWPDAVFSTPTDGSQIEDLMADLDRQPERVSRVRKEGVIHTLQRHDWVYRWREILEAAGLPVPPGVLEREQRLRELADRVGAESAEH